MLDDYRDPVSHVRSMAALASVGGTGLMVVVATPDNALDALMQRTRERVEAYLLGPALFGVALLGLLPLLARGRRRRAPRSATHASARRPQNTPRRS